MHIARCKSCDVNKASDTYNVIAFNNTTILNRLIEEKSIWQSLVFPEFSQLSSTTDVVFESSDQRGASEERSNILHDKACPRCSL